jgi:tetratricopeptide (TPR) repeat protein
MNMRHNKIVFLAAFLILLTLPAAALADDATKIPDYFEASFNHESRGNYQEALNSVLRILRIDHRNYTAMLRAGWLSYLKGDYSNSIDYYRKAAVLQPDAIEPGLGLTLPLMASKQWKEAGAVARKILHRDKDNYLANSRMAYILFSEGRYEEAEKKYQKVLSEYPSDIEMKLGLGWTYARMGQRMKAIEFFRDVLMVRKKNASAQSGLEFIFNKE